jgi:hypothetical protein
MQIVILALARDQQSFSAKPREQQQTFRDRQILRLDRNGIGEIADFVHVAIPTD